MKLFLLILLLTCLPLMQAAPSSSTQSHLVTGTSLCGLKREDITVEIGSSHLPTRTVLNGLRWRCIVDPLNNLCNLKFISNEKTATTNFTMSHRDISSGSFSFGYGTFHERDMHALVNVKVVRDATQLPVHQLATITINSLQAQAFKLLYVENNFLRFDNHYPGVAHYFHELRERLVALRDVVAEYVLVKHATTKHLDGNRPPNYGCSLLNSGLTETLFNDESAEYTIEHGFNQAIAMLSEQIGVLTVIATAADKMNDSELSEFVASDLIAKLTPVMKELNNHKHIVAALTAESFRLGQYIFDKKHF